MEKIRKWFQNLSLQKSMAVHIVIFVAAALFLGNLTAGICDRAAQKINEKYQLEKERYYLTNEEGEQLGEGTYIWKGTDRMSEQDEKYMKILDMLPMIMYPVYSAFGVAAASALFYRSKLKKPLELLTEASSRISENDLDFCVEYQNKDEMGRLCSSFEMMRSALEENKTEMWRLMEERKRLNAAFAHDLRTPLTVLKGYNEMLRLSEESQEKKTADIMAKHIVRMENYVESMSNIRRLEDREISQKEVQLEEFLAVMENSGTVFCEQKGKRFLFQSCVVSANMQLDAELILQVFHNLLSNAVRFAAEYVTVNVKEKEDGLVLTVTDDGAGFSDKALRMGMEPYYHEKKKGLSCSGDSDEETHFGLGLYICKTLCRHHGGTLQIGNTENGAKIVAFFKKVDKK